MNEISKSEAYQRELNRLLSEENAPPLPPCPHDGLPCLTPGRGCECSYGDGEKEDVVLWRCPRFKPGEVV